MNTIEMQRSFLLKAHTLDITEIRDMSSYDIMFLLNQAQDEIIMERWIARSYNDLRPITTSAEIAAASFDNTYVTGITGASVIDLKGVSNYRHYLRSQTKMTRTAVPVISSAVYVNNIPVDYNNLLFFESNGTNRPIFKNPKEIIEGDFLVVLPDYYTSIEKIAVIYVRLPLTMTLDTPVGGSTTNTCELPIHLHQDIVDRAVALSMQTVNRSSASKSPNKGE